VTRLVPPVFTLIRAPERAAIAALAAATALARNALLAARPHLACDPTGEPIDRPSAESCADSTDSTYPSDDPSPHGVAAPRQAD
jgi:hypothetical protein